MTWKAICSGYVKRLGTKQHRTALLKKKKKQRHIGTESKQAWKEGGQRVFTYG